MNTNEPISDEAREAAKRIADNCFFTSYEDALNELALFIHDNNTSNASLQKELNDWKNQWAVMARACGNWRTWGDVAKDDHDHPDWRAAAKAIIERDSLRKQVKELQKVIADYVEIEKKRFDVTWENQLLKSQLEELKRDNESILLCAAYLAQTLRNESFTAMEKKEALACYDRLRAAINNAIKASEPSPE